MYGNPGKGHVVTGEEEANSYGYCSWGCLEAHDPELAKKIEERDARNRAIAIAIAIGILTALWKGIKWLLKIRKENPPLFKKVMCGIIGVLFLVFVVGQVRGCNERKAIEARDCHYRLEEYLQMVETAVDNAKNSPDKAESSPDKLKEAIQKIETTCPHGGKYKYKLSKDNVVTVRCTKHGKLKE